ncbi:hypothetical protein EDB80DRAFT_877363 [Ilyonectria destructans]|nr:hypothetical protein EDB80DRAFT_877363 [Ilyonectria destructans]
MTDEVEVTPVVIVPCHCIAHCLFGRFKFANLDYTSNIDMTKSQVTKKCGKDNFKDSQTDFTAMCYAMPEPEQKGSTAQELIVTGPKERVVGRT